MTEEATRLRELLAINRLIASTTDYDECLHLVVQKARALVSAEGCLLLVAEPGRAAVLGACVGLPPERVRDLHAVLDERLDATLRERLALGPARALTAVPMILRGDVRGILVVVQCAERPLSSEDEGLLSALADQAALLLGEKARLEELEGALAAAHRERRAREETLSALDKERRWLRAVIEHSPIPVLLIEGSGGARVTANVRTEELFGRPIAHEAGTTQYAGQICAPDGTPLPRERIPATEALRGNAVRSELAIRRPDGTLVPVLVSAGPIPDERGDMLGAVVLYEDLTAIKELERMREEWTSVVAHDLRQPVHAIALRAQLLEQDPGKNAAKVQHAIAHILKATQNLSRMIDDLLDSSLLEAQRLVLVRRPHDVSVLLREAIDRSTPAIAGHLVTLNVTPDLPPVEVDFGRIEQVLMNLLGNAARYGAGDRAIEVVAEGRADGVEISVRNFGPRIDPEIAPHLFERFRRGSKGEGLGLGLYISKGIVEGHGGKIWVESTAEGRTTFHFTLPARVSAALESSAAPRTPSPTPMRRRVTARRPAGR
jgi:PAS domain S-box-containing protein